MSKVTVATNMEGIDMDDLISRSEYKDHLSSSPQLLYLIQGSSDLWVGRYDGVVACVCGLVPPSLLSNQAYMWLVTTEVIPQHRFLLARYSRIFIERMLMKYDTIVGVCKLGQDMSIKWLKWLGAEFKPPMGDNVPFIIRRK